MTNTCALIALWNENHPTTENDIFQKIIYIQFQSVSIFSLLQLDYQDIRDISSYKWRKYT